MNTSPRALIASEGRPSVRDFALTLVSDRRRAPAGDLVALAREAARLGIDRIQVREKDLSDRVLRNLVSEIVQATSGTPVQVLVNGRPDIASVTGAHGVQLPEQALPVQEVRRAFPGLLIGVSCHCSESAERAAAGGADFVLLGPIFPTPGKQGPFLGLAVLAEVSRRLGVPVHAIGGMDVERAREVRAAGARGLAAIRLFHSTPLDPALEALRKALEDPRDGGRP